MCKRYFVEVTGLGEDGEQKLKDAGIAKESILVVDEPQKHKALVNAITEVMGITWEGIRKGPGDRQHVSARIAYVHFSLEDGDSTDEIARDLGKTRRYIGFYQSGYDERLFGDKYFRGHISRISALLENDPQWCPPKVQRPARSKKKRRRRRKRQKFN